MTLTHDQRRGLQAALIAAFSTEAKLKQFVKLELDKNLDVIGTGADLSERVLKLIENAEDNGWEAQLIFAARESKPGNPNLSAFVRVYEDEYCEQLAQNATNAIVEIRTQVAQVIQAQPDTKYYELMEKLMEKLQEIFNKLNEPEKVAAARVKLAFNLIPGILSYEVELGTESPLRNVFQPIKRLVEEARTKK